MPIIGNREVNLDTVDRDETIYVGSSHSVSHKDTVALRRTRPTAAGKPLRTNVRFERGFPVGSEGAEHSVTVSIAVTLSPGITPADAETYVSDSLTQAATMAGKLAISGDIHL